MWRASSSLSLISLLIVTAASVARADYRDALDYADARVRDAAAAVDAAQYALDDARARRDAAGAELQKKLDSIRSLEQSLPELQRQIEDTADALAGLERELPARQAARDQAERRAREADAIVRQIHDEAWAPFSQSPEFVDAERAVARDKERVDLSVEAVQQRLAEDRVYRDLAEDAREAEQRLEALRDDPRADPNERAAASQRWLDAKAAVQRYGDEAVENDSAVRDARAALDEASRRQRAMLDGFEASLDADPKMREAKDGLVAAESALASADRALRDALAARDAAAWDLHNLESARADREAQLARDRARADELAAVIDGLEHDLPRFANDLNGAIAALDYAARERDLAAAQCGEVIVGFQYDYGHDHGRRYHDHDDHYRKRDHDYHHDHDDGHDHDRGQDRARGEDRGTRYERHDQPEGPKPDPRGPARPPGDKRDRPAPQLIDEQEREQAAREEAQRHEDARRAARERREAEWRQRRE